MAPLLKCLLYTYENWGFNLQYPCKKPGEVAGVCKPSTREPETGFALEFIDQAV